MPNFTSSREPEPYVFGTLEPEPLGKSPEPEPLKNYPAPRSFFCYDVFGVFIKKMLSVKLFFNNQIFLQILIFFFYYLDSSFNN